MAENRSSVSDFERALGNSKKQAEGVAQEVSGAAQDLYDQAIESTSRVASSAQNAARSSADSFEQALRNTIENKPYTTLLIAAGIGWLLGRVHRPL
jgi:ElaB/YqjD/DUF883 family membrane-anchored ribosome-binding protein